ncbi:hypothetical protein BV25DRAFT_1826312 [Artomyces pyxidatus]|uniref:Uncharacterized protein n=1 Tax=Artomyces pyxidatus TaxID=48021 RepID=A0ACB8SZH3_9AGAM|nr:hypothetical protein BV25DRAFT_1826312 [Artomyces pyxidatus]
MPRRAAPILDISIAGDEQEQSRIQLEHNLIHTDLSLHLSSAPDDYSLEYPRHNSGPAASFSAFHSMEHSREDFDPEEGLSQMHAWSYRTGDDDEGVHPFLGGDTMSTAAHHASALTLSAGLGGRAARRDASLSGAEYDPERPLQDLVAGIDSKFSIFDDNTRSKHISVPFDPLIVDSTAELDRVLSSQHARAAAARARSPRSAHSSSTSGSEPETPDPTTSRPKLSDGLSHLMFSPKRPRSPALMGSRPASPALSFTRTHRPKASSNSAIDPRHFPSSSGPQTQSTSVRVREDVDQGEPTPRPRKVQTQVHHPRPEITVRPPTPSTANSKFTKLARNIARDIEDEQSRWNAPIDLPNHAVQAQSTLKTRAKPSAATGRSPFGYPKKVNGGVHLPDVTGLTNAVESPAKGGLQYYPYEDDEDEYGDGQARLHATLGLVQQKLAHLDQENNTSRRRMRELERELEECKREVAHERDRVMQREEVILKQRMLREEASNRKGKARVPSPSDEDQRRYKEAVEEKKALEALITTLRSHMSRLSTELASHNALLNELRSLREADSHTLREKVREVDMLRTEVEKVAGEVEVLKGVVEEGLRERRTRHERSQSYAQESEDRHRLQGEQELTEEEAHSGEENMQQESEDELEEAAPAFIQGRSSPPPARIVLPDRTMRTDHATIGSSQLTGANSGRYVDDSELERISAELEERRSERSASRLGESMSRSQSSTHSRVSQHAPSLASSLSGSERSASRSSSRLGLSTERDPPPRVHIRAATPDTTQASQRLRRHASSPVPIPASRPPAPTPAHASGQPHTVDDSHIPQRRASKPPPTTEETPFPQIRGAQLERLFFSAPDHNAKTCTVCRRRQRPESGEAALQRPLWYPASKGRDVRVNVDDVGEGEDDEGFAEGSDTPEYRGERAEGKRKAPEAGPSNLDFLKNGARRDRLPPQTVLVRVLRELEDDFTHYKGIYTELADQYKLMDPASNVVKRNVLAQHLREVIDTLEQRGDQIASLYDLLTFEDKPVAQSTVHEKGTQHPARPRSGKKHLTFA